MNTDEQRIRELIEQWHRATGEGDVETVLTLMADDAEFFTPGREPMKGRAAFAERLRAVVGTHRIDSSGDVREVQVSGDLAVAVSLLTVRIVPLGAGEENTRSGYAMSVFRRQPEGAWRLVRDANLLPAPA